MQRITLPVKAVDETVATQFNFLNVLAIGETVSSASVTASVYSGTDASPSDILNGVASVSSPIVTQSVWSGTAGVTYLLECLATTSASRELQISAYLVVVSD